MSAVADPNTAAATGELPPLAGAEVLRGRLMQRTLAALLDQARGSREVLPHLAALESALGITGAAAIEQIPPQHAAKVFTQLRVLPAQADDPVMQDLLARVQQVVRRHGSVPARSLSPFDPEATVVITEASHTDFMNALGDDAPSNAAR